MKQVAEFYLTPKLSAIQLPENAKNATHNIVEEDVFQLRHVKKHARRTIHQLINLNAIGQPIHQNARNLMLVLIHRKNVMTHVRLQLLLNVIFQTINALDVNMVRMILSACIQWTTAKSCKKEGNVNHKHFKVFIE